MSILYIYIDISVDLTDRDHYCCGDTYRSPQSLLICSIINRNKYRIIYDLQLMTELGVIRIKFYLDDYLDNI
jgi:hypothetical protein